MRYVNAKFDSPTPKESRIKFSTIVDCIYPLVLMTSNFEKLCRVYTCRFDNHVPNGKLVKKYFLAVKLAQYFVCAVDRKLASYCNQEILILKLGKLLLQTSNAVVNFANKNPFKLANK